MPELKGETVGVPSKGVQERDLFSKLKGKAYADLKRGATLKSIRVGNTVLFKAEKTNKLSTNLKPDPFKVINKAGSEVSLRNKASVELKRNTMFIKKCNERRDVTNSEEDQVLQAGSAVQVDKPRASQIPEMMPKEFPGTCEVSENFKVQPKHFPDKEDTGAGRPVQRLTQTVRPPDRYKAI